MIEAVVISAPFGNYIQPGGTTPTLGTFTLKKRPGRMRQVIKTLRKDKQTRAWVNKIGLRNPGIDSLIAREHRGGVRIADKLVSIHGFDDAEWRELLDRVRRLGDREGESGVLGVELNMSCPNVGEEIGGYPDWLFAGAVESGLRVVVKLPPVRYSAMADAAIEAGVRTYHCCNTLPVAGGGMSGKPLMAVALECVEDVAGRLVRAGGGGAVIGGGGVETVEDARRYVDAGAQHVALGTRVMHPKYLLGEGDLRGLVDGITRVVLAQ